MNVYTHVKRFSLIAVVWASFCDVVASCCAQSFPGSALVWATPDNDTTILPSADSLAMSSRASSLCSCNNRTEREHHPTPQDPKPELMIAQATLPENALRPWTARTIASEAIRESAALESSLRIDRRLPSSLWFSCCSYRIFGRCSIAPFYQSAPIMWCVLLPWEREMNRRCWLSLLMLLMAFDGVFRLRLWRVYEPGDD